MNAYIVHSFHQVVKDKTLVFLIGRLENGETFAVADGRHQPWFYVRHSDVEKVRSLVREKSILIESSEFRTMDSEPVWKVSSRRSGDLKEFSEALTGAMCRHYEADINHCRHYLMQLGIKSCIGIEGTWRRGDIVDRVYDTPTLSPATCDVELSVCSLDIETIMAGGKAVSINAVSLIHRYKGTATRVVHLLANLQDQAGAGLRCHATEKALLKAVRADLVARDPDILTGWNVIDFDLPFLQQRYQANGLPFNLGRSREDSWYREGEGWGRSQISIHGRQVLDAMQLVRGGLKQYSDYRLETVAQELLGRGKTLASDTESTIELLDRVYREDPKRFADYCLEDACLVLDIMDKEHLLEHCYKRSLLTGLHLEKTNGSVAPFDFLYISELHKRGLVAPSSGVDRRGLTGAPGGMVMSPRAGLFRHCFVFDFKSLYPSIIRTFNIDPLSLVLGSKLPDDEVLIAPNGARFSMEPAILPRMLDDFFESRDQAKARGDDQASYNYKIIMNSFYGVMGSDVCRFGTSELAGAITLFGHKILEWCTALLRGSGFEVLYGDTDSLFVMTGMPDDVSVTDAFARASGIVRDLNEKLAVWVKHEWNIESRLTLQFETYYRRFLLPQARGQAEQGRAKGYAGLRIHHDGRESMIIKGLEAVRSDWTEMAHQLQREILDLLFHDTPVARIENHLFARVAEVRSGKRDADLIYRKRLRKDVDEYVKNVPPHVQAARLMEKPSGMIDYWITTDGPQPIHARTAPIDYDFYVDHQIAPLVASLADICGLDVAAAVYGEQSLFRNVDQARR